jgi:hypothetical protein
VSPRPRPSRPSGASRPSARDARKPAESPAPDPTPPPAPGPARSGWLTQRLTAIPERVREVTLVVAGTVVSVWAALLLSAAGAFLTPLRIGTVLAPVSLVLGIGGNIAIMWFAYRVSANKYLGVLPGLIWVVLTFIASGSTRERDLVLYQGNWVAIAYLLSGSGTVGVVAYRMFVPRPPT